MAEVGAGKVAEDWDLCLVCESAFTLVGEERNVRTHGPRNRRCRGSGMPGVYLTDREKDREF